MFEYINITLLKMQKYQAVWRTGLSWLFIAVLSVLFSGCEKYWDEHYTATDPTINELLWEEIQLMDEYTVFVDHIIENELDTILMSNQQYTLFVPNNEAFSNLPDTTDINAFFLQHLISPSVFSLRNIQDIGKLQTLSGKFALIEVKDTSYYFDAAKIIQQSPLYLDGRYYEVNEFPFAKPNFNEYFKNSLPVIYNYVHAQVYDSLDKKQSIPIRIENGKTIYDSVFVTISPFENEYFPISEESREDFATFVLFSQEQYNAALDVMANNLGGSFTSHEDIPLMWQESILLPIVLKNGVFENALSIEQLSDPNLLNIRGEKVVMDVSAIDPESRISCSNGYIYEFYDFQVPDSLYLGEVRIEGESLIDSIGQDRYAWRNDVTLKGEILEPFESISEQASEQAYVVVSMGRSFTKDYSVEFSFKNIFPGRQRLVWRANYRPSGIYRIFVNDVQVGEPYDTYNLRSPLLSVTGEIFRPTSSGFNSVDFWVENLTEFGDVKVRFEYMGSGISTVDGFNIDYVSLIPDPN